MRRDVTFVAYILNTITLRAEFFIGLFFKIQKYNTDNEIIVSLQKLCSNTLNY